MLKNFLKNIHGAKTPKRHWKYMKLPHRKNCIITKEKLTKYLLNLRHPTGRSKAVFFTRVGFNKADFKLLKKELLKVALENDAFEVNQTFYAKKYRIDGSIKTPTNRYIKVTTLWIIDKESRKPRFITAYPLKHSSLQ